MSTRTLTIEHNGVTYYGHVAMIEKTELNGQNDHGIADAWLHCKWPGSGIGVGGYVLNSKPETSGGPRKGTAYGFDYLLRVMDTVGVYRWEDLKGQFVVVLFEEKNALGSRAVGIAGVANDKVFILEDHAQEWRDAEAVTS